MRRQESHGPLDPRVGRWIRRLSGGNGGFAVPHSHFWCDTEDGVRLAGSLLGDRREGAAVVFAHGFMGYRSKPGIRVLTEALAQRFAVFVFDLRGHGQSHGFCTGGDLEMHDVHAVVQHARARGFERVVTVGGSLGGIAVLRAAAHYQDVDAVVSISAPALWGVSESAAVRRATWLFTTRLGRGIAYRMLGTRISLSLDPTAEAPADVISRIAPAPVLIVHGDDDHFFSLDQAKLLHERAGEPKRLWVIPGFGHAEDGFNPEFARRLGDEIEALLAAGRPAADRS